MKTIGIIGGGAAGFFAAINIAEKIKLYNINARVIIFESSQHVLRKVKISGGGRCNVTHNQFDPKLLAKNYPRGFRELIGPLHSFGPQDTVEWFSQRGVKIKSEEDGRMFPVTNNSQTIIDCFLNLAHKNKVQILTKTKVLKVTNDLCILTPTNEYKCDYIVIATGSTKTSYKIAQDLGHKITPLAPSLFSFKISHPLLKDMQGISFKNIKLSIKLENKKFEQEGPMLITHWGLSGPAILKLSAWAAREFKSQKYKGILKINFTPDIKENQLIAELENLFKKAAKTKIGNLNQPYFTQRFWTNFLKYLELDSHQKCSDLSQKTKNKIIQNIINLELNIQGQNRFKDEFVECGGIDLKEIKLKTMQSKINSKIYFSGEVLDIDGITGGFNFQNAWTGSYNLSEHIISELTEN